MTNIEKAIETLGEKINELEFDIYVKDQTIKRLEEELKKKSGDENGNG